MKQQQSGFTLIELVIVIVILGILAAAALPRFTDLSTDARTATLNGLMGSIRSAAAISHATELAKGVSGATITLEGNTVTIQNGYPSATAISAALGDYSGFTFSAVSTSATFTSRAGCLVTYLPSTGAGFSVSTTTTGC